MTTEIVRPAPDGTATCPNCGRVVPDSGWCGACGARLGPDSSSRSRRRWGAYAAFPDQALVRLSVVSALFPRLASHARQTFRAAFVLIAALLLALALSKLSAAVTAASAVAVPLLFFCYVGETEPADARALVPAFGALAGGALLGVAAAVGLGEVVSRALVPTVGPLVVDGALLRSALLAPVIVQLLMIVPVAALRVRRPAGAGPLEGFTAGAAGALGLSAAMTLTELSAGTLVGNVARVPVLTVVAEAAIRGISLPLLGAATSGYVGAALWRRADPGARAGGRWLTSPFVALITGVVVQVGLGFGDDAALADVPLIAVHLGAALLALLALRVGLHHLLLNDRQSVRIGERHPCPKCGHLVPAMPFCPNCGGAEQATAQARWPGNGRVPTTRSSAAASVTAATRGDLAPTEASRASGSPTHAVSFPLASRAAVGSTSHLGRRQLLGAVVAGLAVAIGIFVVLAEVLPSARPAPCVSLRCFSPFGPVRARPGGTFTSDEGWGLTWYPASAVFAGPGLATRESSSRDVLRLAFTSSVTPAEDGDLYFVGEPAKGQSAAHVVTSLQRANAPDAALDYVLPNATIGYHRGYGAAFETAPVSTYGDSVVYELVIVCAVVNGEAVCAYGLGPRVDVTRVVNHPTPSHLALSLWSDPDVNSVVWASASSTAAVTSRSSTALARGHSPTTTSVRATRATSISSCTEVGTTR